MSGGTTIGSPAYQEYKQDGHGCNCDFCTGKKSRDDNWCPRCSEFMLEEPKRWENLEVCDRCERQIRQDTAADAMYWDVGLDYAEPRIARGDS